MRAWWRGLGPTARAVLVLVVIGVGVNVATRVLDSTIGGRDPEGPPASSYSTTPDGLAAWATLLEEAGGHDVTKVRSRLDRAVLEPSSTLVIADPETIEPSELAAAAAFVRAGGRIVATGEQIGEVVPGLGWQPGGATHVRLPAIPDVGTAREVLTRGEGTWGDDQLIVATDIGAGRVVALADLSPLTNDLIDEADNAALAIAIVGDGPVHFAESVHGYGADGLGVDDLPPGWTTTIIGLALAAIALLWSAGRRFGPPIEEEELPPPPRRAYVDAMAAATARAGSPDEAVEPLRRRARGRLARRTGVDAAVSDTELVAAAARAGVDPSLVAAVVDGGALELGRAAAELEEAHP